MKSQKAALPSPTSKPQDFTLDRLSASQWELMRICWKLKRATVHEVLRESLDIAVRDYNTVLTHLSRMAAKGYLSVEKIRNTNYYSPAYPPEVALDHEIRCFLEQVIGPEPEHRALLLRHLHDGPTTKD